MKIKVLKSKKTKFPSYWTPVKIVVKGEEDKGEQEKGLKVIFSEEASKKLPAKFKGGIIELKGEDVNYPFVYEIKEKDGEPDYPFVYIKDFDAVKPLKPMKNTCTFIGCEEDTEETEISEDSEETEISKDSGETEISKDSGETEISKDSVELDKPDDDLPF